MVPTIKKTLPVGYDATLERLLDALKSEGFGVLTEVDLKRTLEAKLGVELRRYKILGVCNPPLAHKALTANIDAGLMMPCNVVVYEEPVTRTTVQLVDPMSTFVAQQPELRPIAEEVRAKLMRVFERL